MSCGWDVSFVTDIYHTKETCDVSQSQKKHERRTHMSHITIVSEVYLSHTCDLTGLKLNHARDTLTIVTRLVNCDMAHNCDMPHNCAAVHNQWNYPQFRTSNETLTQSCVWHDSQLWHDSRTVAWLMTNNYDICLQEESHNQSPGQGKKFEP